LTVGDHPDHLYACWFPVLTGGFDRPGATAADVDATTGSTVAVSVAGAH
jgi:hypothetical protein